MSSRLVHPLENCRRQLRLLYRHLRYGHAGFCEAGRQSRSLALEELFCGTNRFLRSLGLEPWLDFGTLLGWHRDGKIIPHDKDVDFGAPVEAYPLVLAARHRLPPGFAMYDTSHRHFGPKLYFSYKTWEADLYFYRTEGSLLRPLIRSEIPSDSLPLERDWVLPLRATQFLGQDCFVPAQPERYLSHLYAYLGPDAVRDPVSGYFKPRQASAPMASVSDPSTHEHSD